MCWILLLLAASSAHAQPLHLFDFEADDASLGWSYKSNTTIEPAIPQPHDGRRALRFSIDPVEFSYGWIHRDLPDVDLSELAGIHGFFRGPAGVQGTLLFHLCLPTPGEDMSYFQGDLGDLADSRGEWVEFYVGLGDLRHERGPLRSVRERPLGPPDLMQFMASLGTRDVTAVDIDTIRFVRADEAEPIAKRAREAARRRQLRPGHESTGAPHPRLLLTPDRLAYYQAKATAGGEVQAGYDRLLALADALLTSYDADDPLGEVYEFVETTDLEGTPWRAAFEGHLVVCSYPLETLAAAYVLTGDERYGAHATTALVNAAGRLTTDEPFLSQGFYYTRTQYVRALAFAYDWLHDRLSPEQRKTVQTTLMGFVLDIHERSQSDGWGRRPLHRVWNWDPGLMAACGLGMLALEGETRLAEQAIIFDCRRHLRDYLTLGIDADGCCHEGPSYIGYGIGAGPEFAEALRQQGRGDLFTETNYHLIPPWLVAETLPDGKRWNNLSDCGHGQTPSSVYMYACARFAELAKADSIRDGERLVFPNMQAPLGFLQQFVEAPGERKLSYGALAGLMEWEWRTGPGRVDPSEYDARKALAHVLLYDPIDAAISPEEVLPNSMHFRGRGLVVSRTGFGPEDVHLAIEAGPHAAGHDQCDKGTFTFRAYGGDLVIDSGYGNDGELLKSASSHAHNVVLIDGQGMPMRYHNQSGGKITGYASDELADWIRVDAREAWGVRYDADWKPSPTDPVLRAERQFIFVRPSGNVPPYLVVYDNIQKDAQPRDYTWQWHIPASMRFALGDECWTTEPRPREVAALMSDPEVPGASATFAFDVPEAGRYHLYGLVRAGGPAVAKSDSFFVTVDDGDKMTWDIRSGPSLAWDPVLARGETGPRAFDLAAGPHAITLEHREPQAEWCRWLLLPEGADAPLDPEGAPDEAIAVEVEDAQMGNPAFAILEPGQIDGPKATLDVFLASPEGGETETMWFETSREGAHPKLQYTVRAEAPHFVAVLVPRTTGVPRPKVRSLAEGHGVEVVWGDARDTIEFDAGAKFARDAGNASSNLKFGM